MFDGFAQAMVHRLQEQLRVLRTGRKQSAEG